MSKRDETKEAKKFGRVLAIGCALFAAWMFYRDRMLRAEVAAGLSVAFFLVPVVVPALWLVLFRQWMKVAEALSFVMTRVILGIFFFVFLTPVALVLRVLGRRPLDLAYKDGKASYWVDKPANELTVERYRKQY